MLCVFFAAILCSSGSRGDVLADAEQLLKVSNTANHFQSRTQSQIRNILRTYASIVAMESDVELPTQISSAIADCYTREYAWENFQSGFAEILAEQLSQREILILIDFYRNRGLPPADIPAFKATIAKADLIEAMSAEYIFNSGSGCVQQDAYLISDFLRSIDQHIALDAGSE